jgi:hypothetical protein
MRNPTFSVVIHSTSLNGFEQAHAGSGRKMAVKGKYRGVNGLRHYDKFSRNLRSVIAGKGWELLRCACYEFTTA